MADNRANMPNGVTRPKNSDYIDPKTIKAMNEISSKYETLIKSTFGTVKNFEKVIKEATNMELERTKKEKENTDKWNKTLNEVSKQFGQGSKEWELVLGEAIKQTKIVKEESEKASIEMKRNIIKQSFKNETSAKEIKYLNNSFAKGNNLASVNNRYFKDLESLKSEALDVYFKKYKTFEGFDKTKEYKQALMNLNDKYATDMKEAWKKDFKENHKVLGSVADGIKDTFDKNKEALKGILGPLNLIISPLKDFFGGFGMIFKGIKGGVKWLFGKFTKKNPTVNDVLKSGAMGVGALYIGNKLDKMFSKTDESGLNMGGLSSLLPKSLRDLLGENSNLIKNLKLISSLGGGLLVIKDFVEEFAKNGDWRGGLSKAVTGSSMMENAIKGALIGFGVGGPVGAIVGALGGVALNYFSPQVEKFIRNLTGDPSEKKKNLLKNIEKDVSKGKRSQQELDIYNKLATTNMSDADFAKLGKGTFESESDNRRDWIRQYAKGNLDVLSDEELLYMGNLFMKDGYKIANELGADKFREVLGVLGGLNDFTLSTMMKKNKNVGNFAKTIVTLNSTKNMNPKDFSSWLKSSGLTGEEYNQIMASAMMSGLTESDIESMKSILSVIDPKGKINIKDFSDMTMIDDAIIRTDGKIIKTNPKDTLVALKDIPLSVNQIRDETNKNLNGSLSQMERDGSLEKKLTTIIDVLSKILEKDLQVQLPPQTRSDLDLLMQGALV